jgi:hypothetical protein
MRAAGSDALPRPIFAFQSALFYDLFRPGNIRSADSLHGRVILCDRVCVYAVTVRLRCAPPTSAPLVRRVGDILRSVARADDGLEHLYAEAARDGVNIMLFLVAESLPVAESTALRLVQRAQDAGLTCCHPVSCQVELVVSFAEAGLALDDDPAKDHGRHDD